MLGCHEQLVLCERADKDNASVGLERKVVWRDGMRLERLPLGFKFEVSHALRRAVTGSYTLWSNQSRQY